MLADEVVRQCSIVNVNSVPDTGIILEISLEASGFSHIDQQGQEYIADGNGGSASHA